MNKLSIAYNENRQKWYKDTFSRFAPYKNIFIVEKNKVLKYEIYYCEIKATTYSFYIEIWCNLGSDERFYEAKLHKRCPIQTFNKIAFYKKEYLKGNLFFLTKKEAECYKKEQAK